MTSYDPKVICRYASDLYRRARLLVIMYTLAGILIGISVGKMYAQYEAFTSAPPALAALAFGALTGAQPTPSSSSPGWTVLGALFFGLFGFWIGTNKAFVLRLQAQTALCQVKIEENTHPAQA